MPDIVQSLKRHLRADATIQGYCGLPPKCRVDYELSTAAPSETGPAGEPVPVYPQIVIEEGEPLYEHRASTTLPVTFIILADGKRRSDAIGIRARLRELFQEQAHLHIASGTADSLLVIRSLEIPSGQGPQREEGIGPWVIRETYSFTIPS